MGAKLKTCPVANHSSPLATHIWHFTSHGNLRVGMSLAVNRENFFWHKVHSLTGIVPIGFYMLQHLTLNSFSLAGPEHFNGVISFFGSMPWYILLGMEI